MRIRCILGFSSSFRSNITTDVNHHFKVGSFSSAIIVMLWCTLHILSLKFSSSFSWWTTPWTNNTWWWLVTFRSWYYYRFFPCFESFLESSRSIFFFLILLIVYLFTFNLFRLVLVVYDKLRWSRSVSPFKSSSENKG